MTGRLAGRRSGHPDATADGWRGCAPELAVTAALILATSAAVYGYDGAGAAVLTLIIWAVLLLALMRGLVAAAAPRPRQQQTWRAAGRTSFTGFWRKRGMLADATASMVRYDAELRPTLQHLLAARRQLLQGSGHGPSRGGRDDQLWHWLDPSRPAETRQQPRGIPPRTLEAIIDRLERL